MRDVKRLAEANTDKEIETTHLSIYINTYIYICIHADLQINITSFFRKKKYIYIKEKFTRKKKMEPESFAPRRKKKRIEKEEKKNEGAVLNDKPTASLLALLLL